MNLVQEEKLVEATSKKITKDGVLIDNRFGDVDFLVKFSEITMATKIK